MENIAKLNIFGGIFWVETNSKVHTHTHSLMQYTTDTVYNNKTKKKNPNYNLSFSLCITCYLSPWLFDPKFPSGRLLLRLLLLLLLPLVFCTFQFYYFMSLLLPANRYSFVGLKIRYHKKKALRIWSGVHVSIVDDFLYWLLD